MKITEKDFTGEELLDLLNESSMGIFFTSSSSIQCINPSFTEMTGYNEEDLIGSGIERFTSPESLKNISEHKHRITDTLGKGQVVRREDKQLPAEIIHKDGRQLKFLMLLQPSGVLTEDKWCCYILEQSAFEEGNVRGERMDMLKDYLLDISQSLIRLKDIQNFYTLVLEAASKTIGQSEYSSILKLVGEDTLVPVASRGYAWEVMAEFELPADQSFSWLTLGHMIDRTIIIDDIEKLCEKTESLVEVKGYKIRSALQTPIFLNDELYGILSIDSSRKNVFTKDDFNSIEYLRTQIQIALENQLLYNKMHHQASHDELTNVASRGTFEEQVVQFLRTRHHYESCCIIMMDINDLKTVNDNWGHAAGDQLLLKFIKVMQKSLRGSDLLARLGGDEFAICFFSSQSAQFIERLEEIQQYFVDSPLMMGGRPVSCYFSYGIAYCPEDGESYSILLKKADLEMYKMKAELKKQNLKNDLHDLR